MLAAGVLRAFPVPVFPDVSANELATYTLHGLPTMAIAEDQEQVDKLIELRERIGRPATIIYDDDRGLGTYSGAGIVSFDTVIASGLRRLAAEPGLASELIGCAGPDDIAVLLHSSGTTGTPKGIPLRHRNILGGVANAAAAGYFGSNEELFAYLPTAWVGDFCLYARCRPVSSFDDQHSGTAGNRLARSARGGADILSRGASGVGQHADQGSSRHGRLDTAEAPLVQRLHAKGHRAGAQATCLAENPLWSSGWCTRSETCSFMGRSGTSSVFRAPNAPLPAARRSARIRFYFSGRSG